VSEELFKLDKMIKDVPNINDYPEIIKAAKEGRLIIFIGAGVSKLVDIPLWSEFAKKSLDYIHKRSLVDFRTYKDLQTLDPKKLLSICKIIMKENKIQPEPATDIFKFDKDDKYNDVYSKLYSINAIFITTNYDECLDFLAMSHSEGNNFNLSEKEDNILKISNLKVNGEVIINREDLLESKLKNGNVIHLHGSVKNEKEMLVTINDYLNYYGNVSLTIDPTLNTFLNKVFNSKYVVLFIGYGLEEYEVLEYILNKSKNPNYRKHYMLYSAYKEDNNFIKLLGKYYMELGVELIPYNISQKGYEQLIDIITEWSKVLSEVSRESDFIQKTLLIDEKINDKKNIYKDYLEVSINTVLDLIKSDEYLETYFFDNIKDKEWLPELIVKGYYKPENIPINIRNGYGYWNKADFLIKIAKALKAEDEYYIHLVVKIIRDVSLYKDENMKHIDNYHIWAKFIEIISQIPGRFIGLEIIKLIKFWLDSEFDVEYTSYKVAKEILIKYFNSDEKVDIEKIELIVDYLTENDNKGNIKINNFYNNVFNKENVSIITNKCSIDLIINIKNKLRKLIVKSKSNIIIKCDDMQFLLELEIKDKFYVTMSEVGEMNIEDLEKPYEILGNKKVAFDLVDKKDLVNLISEFILGNMESAKLEKDYEKKILIMYYRLFTEGTYHSLYDFNIEHSPDGYELILDLFLKMLINNKDDLSELLKTLLNEEYFLFQKVLLYVIGNNMGKYISIFWYILNHEKGKFIFENAAFEDELKVILEQIKSLDDVQQNKLIVLIYEGPSKESEEDEDQQYVDVWKQKRLNSLKHLNGFNKLYKEIKDKTKIDTKLGPIIGKLETKWSSHESPLKLEDLLEMDNLEIAEFLKNFKTKDFWEGPSSEGLKDEITNLSMKYPNKIINDMDSFINTNSYYIYGIIEGIKEAWRLKESFNWDKLFAFILSYMDRESFWKDEFKYYDGHWNATYKWVISAVADLISEGTSMKSWAFEFSNYNKAKEILIVIYNNIGDLAEEINDDDYITYVLNSIRGKTLEAIIDMSLYKKNRDKDIWDIELKTLFEKYLFSNVVDAYITFGLYLPQFYYLDKDWTVGTIKKINYKEVNWEPFMCGYLNNNTIYGYIYMLMKEHYANAIIHKFKDNNLKDSLAEHIGVGVISGVESENNFLLLNNIIENWDYQMIKKLIWYFSSINSDKEEKAIDLDPNAIDCIIKFWDVIYNKYNDYKYEDLNKDEKEIISRSGKLVKVLKDINETNYYLLKFSLPYIEKYESFIVIENFQERITKDDNVIKRKIIGELILIIVENCVDDFEKDKLAEIVEYLYEINNQDVKDIANKICNIYQMNNIDFLKNIYLKYND
jgi:hypothetical protein